MTTEKVLKVTKTHKEGMKKWVKFTSEGNDNGVYCELVIASGKDGGPQEKNTFWNIKKE